MKKKLMLIAALAVLAGACQSQAKQPEKKQVIEEGCEAPKKNDCCGTEKPQAARAEVEKKSTTAIAPEEKTLRSEAVEQNKATVASPEVKVEVK